MKRVRITWPPAEETADYDHEKRRHRVQDGETVLLDLKRWDNDRSLRANSTDKCCDCGLRHLNSYEVLRAPNGEFFMVWRSYRINDYKPKPRKLRKKPRRRGK